MGVCDKSNAYVHTRVIGDYRYTLYPCRGFCTAEPLDTEKKDFNDVLPEIEGLPVRLTL